jgi:hypothetical protein
MYIVIRTKSRPTKQNVKDQDFNVGSSKSVENGHQIIKLNLEFPPNEQTLYCSSAH